MRISIVLLFSFIFLTSCREVRIHEHEEWAAQFRKYGIKDGCFILRDHTHESVHMYNKARCLQRFSPASTFKIVNSLIALESVVAADETLVIPWDKVERWNPLWNRDMTMAEAFKVSNVPYYQEIARRIGRERMQVWLDTLQYGNMATAGAIDNFWLNDTLQISADEQVGLMKRLYFERLPMSARSQRLVRNMMEQSDTAGRRLFYKTGRGVRPGKPDILWIVGFMEREMEIEEMKGSMNKSNIRNYPYFFALNFDAADTTTDWSSVRPKLLADLLQVSIRDDK